MKLAMHVLLRSSAWDKFGGCGRGCYGRPAVLRLVFSTRSEFPELEHTQAHHIISKLYITYIIMYTYMHIIEPLKIKEMLLSRFFFFDFFSKQIGGKQSLRRGPIAWQPRLCREVFRVKKSQKSYRNTTRG